MRLRLYKESLVRNACIDLKIILQMKAIWKMKSDKTTDNTLPTLTNITSNLTGVHCLRLLLYSHYIAHNEADLQS